MTTTLPKRPALLQVLGRGHILVSDLEAIARVIAARSPVALAKMRFPDRRGHDLQPPMQFDVDRLVDVVSNEEVERYVELRSEDGRFSATIHTPWRADGSQVETAVLRVADELAGVAAPRACVEIARALGDIIPGFASARVVAGSAGAGEDPPVSLPVFGIVSWWQALAPADYGRAYDRQALIDAPAIIAEWPSGIVELGLSDDAFAPHGLERRRVEEHLQARART